MNRPLTLDLMYTMPFQLFPFKSSGLVPTMIDPGMIPRIISDGNYVMAVVDGNRTFYVTSDHPEAIYLDQDKKNIPFCSDIMPDWIRTTPWSHLAQMRAFQSGEFLVFIPHDLNEMHITTSRYRFLPRLQAIMVHNAARL